MIPKFTVLLLIVAVISISISGFKQVFRPTISSIKTKFISKNINSLILKTFLLSSLQASLPNVKLEQILMPALSSTMTEGKIVSWVKKVGDKVSSGDTLLVVESDKADMDVESYEDGYLATILVKEGESSAVGAPVALIVKSLADIKLVQDAAAGGFKAPATISQPTPVAIVQPVSTSVPLPNVNFDKIYMPALSSTMTEGKIVSWTKKIGEKVSAGDTLLIVESDKADMDVESYEEGFLASILVAEGDSTTVGAPVALIAKSLSEIKNVQEYAQQLKLGGVPAAVITPITNTEVFITPSTSNPAVSTPIVNDGRISASGYAKTIAQEKGIDLRTVTPSRSDGYITTADLSTGITGSHVHVPAQGVLNASPMARRYAADNNLDVTKIKGTGNFGRVTGDDVLIAAGKLIPNIEKTTVPVTTPSVPVPSTQSTEKPISSTSISQDGVVAMDGMQKAIAKNMEKTLTIPIFRVSREIVTDNFDILYSKLKSKGVSVSAMLAKAVSIVLARHPLLNAAYVDGGIKFNKDVNVAMAVSIDGGLITPTIVKVQDLDIYSVSRSWKDLVDRAKSKKLTPAEYSSGNH